MVLMHLFFGIAAIMLGGLLGLLSSGLLISSISRYTQKSSLLHLFILSQGKLIALALIFYFVLHHTELNLILVVGAFFCVNGLCIRKAIFYGRS